MEDVTSGKPGICFDNENERGGDELGCKGDVRVLYGRAGECGPS
jgi:hypothetical protein